VLSCR